MRLMDPLSDVLALLKVQSVLSARLEGSGPWALRFPAYRHIKFGSVIEGERWLWIDGTSDLIKLAPGDFYLLTDGRPYCFASTPEAPLRESTEVLPADPDSDGVVRFGHGTGRTVGAGGRFMFDDDVDVAHQLFRALQGKSGRPSPHIPGALAIDASPHRAKGWNRIADRDRQACRL